MPAVHCPDATSPDSVAAALARTGAATLDASYELLAHYSDTGDAPSQRAVNTLIDHAADTLRALTDSLADISGELAAARSPELTSGHRARPGAGRKARTGHEATPGAPGGEATPVRDPRAGREHGR